MAAVSTLILIAVSGYMLLTQYQNSRRDREIAVRQTVEVGHSILAWAHQLETSGSHTREQAQQMAQDWGARCVDAGAAGHLNADSGLGDWPQGQVWLQSLIKDLKD